MATDCARSRRLPGGSVFIVELAVDAGPANGEPAGSSGFFCVYVFKHFLSSEY